MSDHPILDEQWSSSDEPRAAGHFTTGTRTRTLPASSEPTLSSDEGTHFSEYIKVLYKRRWTAATAFVLVVLAATVYTFTTTPIYEARTRLLIESGDPNIVTFKEVIDEERTKADYYQTQYNILQSRALARKTIDRVKLWNSSALGADDDQSFSIARALAGLWTSVGTRFGGQRQPDRAVAPDETLAQSRTIDAFLTNLTISPIRNSRLVDIRFRSVDPGIATETANVLARNYIEQNLEYKFSASREATDWLSDRLSEQRKQVETAETALQRYREQNDALSLQDRQNIVVQKLADLNAAVTRAKTERLQKEAMYRQLVAIEQNSTALDTFPAILSNEFIQQQKSELATLQRQQAQLGEKFGDRHPDMIKTRSAIQAAQAKLQGEIAKIVQSVRTEYQAALAQEQSLAAALDQQKGEAQSMNRKAIDYTVLERDVESSRQIYQSLLQRAKETGVTADLKSSSIRVVDEAERPRTPVWPQRALNLYLAVFGGFVLAIGLAFFFEYMDSRIKSPAEIKAHLGLPSIGIIPALGKQWAGRDPLINNGVPPHFAEAFRSVRTNLLFASADEGCRTVVVTSTAPGEGKTMVASNLAMGFALAGQRVLLVDADMRRPRTHEVFKQPQEPGLSNVLVGDAKASESVQKTDVPGLWVLASGHVPPNPAELLGSKRFKDFIRSLTQHFDWIVLDSPPVLPVADALIVSNLASGVVFVAGAEMTSRHAARTALEKIHGARGHVVGVVLNRVELERHAYYYSQYYRRDYASYYQATN